MKYLLITLSCSYLVACSALDVKGNCYYGSAPQQYLVNNAGQQYIDQNGRLVSEKVINPEFVQFQKCWGQSQNATSPVSYVLPQVQTHLNEQYRINQQLFTVLVKPRRTLLSENFHTPMDSFHCWLYEAV